MQKRKLAATLGEITLTVPILIVACFIDLWFEYCLILLCMLVYKTCYEYGYHSTSSYGCLLITYSCFIICMLLSYVFRKQYILVLVWCNVVCYVSYRVGILQYKASRFDIIKEPYEKYRMSLIEPAFNLDNCTEKELLVQLRKHKILPKYYDFLVDVFIHKVRVVDYLDTKYKK